MYNWRNISIEDLLRIKDSHSTSSSALLTLSSSSKSSAMSRWRRKDDSSWSHLKWPETGLCCYFPSALFDLIGFNFIFSTLKDVNMYSGQRQPGGNDCLTSVYSSVQLTKPASALWSCWRNRLLPMRVWCKNNKHCFHHTRRPTVEP